MALKINITKDVFDKLGDDIKKEYVPSGDGYKLDLDGYEDPAELKRARDRERDNANDLRKELSTVQDKLKNLEGDDARKSGDIDRLEARWKSRMDTEVTKVTEKYNTLLTSLRNERLTTEAEKLAAELSDSPKALLPHVRERLSVEVGDNDDISIVYKGDDGKPTKRDDVVKSLRDNKDLSGIIRASKASGGGASHKDPVGNGGAGGTPPSPQGQNTTDLRQMPVDDLKSMIAARLEQRANPQT